MKKTSLSLARKNRRDRPPSSSLITQPRLAQLTRLRAASPDGVITLTSSLFDDLAAGPSRPYTLAVFCTARHLLDKPNLGLRKMRREWGTLSKTVKTAVKKTGDGAPPAATATTFFAVAEFEAAREIFHRLGVDSLPWVVTLPRSHAVPDDGGELGLPHDAVMRHDAYGAKHWDAGDFARFVADVSGEPRIEIVTPPKRPSFFGIMSGLAILAGLAAAAWTFYNSRLARFYPLWVVGTLAVWWFATSGGMYNIIRGMPMVLPTRGGRIKLFLDGGSGQVGFEGFAMGTLYSSVGLAMLGLGTLVPRLSDPAARRAVGYTLALFAWWAYREVVRIHDWKVGFSWHSFLW